ncbi:MAG TPA: MerR family transcriptional regulator [Chloroflexia bacterium]|nr:MerR family transcriptional regulator [Chloroflexia bacterium]
MVDSTLDFAIYSIKAVAHMADVTEPTLRAWEKRYSILSPGRTESGHRRYTKRDIYRVMWLKQRLEEGMSISQASALLQTQPETALLEMAQYEKNIRGGGTRATILDVDETGQTRRQTFTLGEVRSPRLLSERLLEAFLAFDEQSADNLLSEAASIYPPDVVCVDIIQNVMTEIGERWMKNEVTIATEHFASTLCRTRLNAMIEALPVQENGPLVLTACGPHEFHELGIVITTYFLRRAGWRVIYLGQNTPAIDLEKDVRRLRPSLLVFSAGRTETALLLAREILPVVERVRQNWQPDLLFAYGGRALVDDPGLHDMFKSYIYFGDDARQSVKLIEDILPKR